MAFIPVANACAAEIRLTSDSQLVALTLGFYNSGGVNQANLDALSDLLAEFWYGQLRTGMRSTVTLREVYVRDLTSSSGPTSTNTDRAGTGGSASVGTAMPNSIAVCVSFRTGLRGRANRGRNYYFGFGTSQMTGLNYITSTFRSSLIARYETLLPGGAYDPTPYRWCVISRQLDGVIGGRAIPITAVTMADTNLDSMRKRLPGRGV